jgi:hypothetical protein
MLGVRCPHCKKVMGLESEAGDQVHCPYCRGPFRIPRPALPPSTPPAAGPSGLFLPDDLTLVDEPQQPRPLGVGRRRHDDLILPADLLAPEPEWVLPVPTAPPEPPVPAPPPPAPGAFPMLELDAPEPSPAATPEEPAPLAPLAQDTPRPAPPLDLAPAEPILRLELGEDAAEPATAEPAPLPAIPLSLEESAPPAEAIPVAEALPVQEPTPFPEPEEDVPLARLVEPAAAEECEGVEDAAEDAVTRSPSAPRRDQPRRRPKRDRKPELNLREPIWMRPGQSESPLTRNRVFGAIAVVLGPLFLIFVLAGGRLFTYTPYRPAFWALGLLGLALVVGGVIALTRG